MTMENKVMTQPFRPHLLEMLAEDELLAIEFLRQIFEAGDRADIIRAVATVAEARGNKAALARAAGVERSTVYDALKEGANPRVDTFFEILKALDIRLTVHSMSQPALPRKMRARKRPNTEAS